MNLPNFKVGVRLWHPIKTTTTTRFEQAEKFAKNMNYITFGVQKYMCMSSVSKKVTVLNHGADVHGLREEMNYGAEIT